eukprot:TRINITY_DN108943_c0_g1_i1.p1 TRINITY_DN108943_c0_g1~~TRINITY_DN108943_c0_g1_i1.p1  ORF type:complete len:367 (-),score=61.73 TRINITY_DN108943_c0_g1_i1:51-1151(-)
MQAQYTPLHSKLWTRRWPNLQRLVLDIAIAVVPSPPPKVATGLTMLSDPKPPKFHDLKLSNMSSPAKPIPLPPLKDPMQEISRKVRALDCPAQKGWFLKHGLSEDTICRCGGGSHKLKVAELTTIVCSVGFEESAFLEWLQREKCNWADRSVNDFVRAYLEGSSPDVLRHRKHFERTQRKLEKRNQRAERAFEKQQQKYQLMQKERDNVCASYRRAYDDALERARLTYCEYVSLLLMCVPHSKAIDARSATIPEATKAAMAAIELNQQNEDMWRRWLQEDLGPWLEVQDALVSLRSDLFEAMSHRQTGAADQAWDLLRAADKAEESIKHCYCDWHPFQRQLEAIENKWSANEVEWEDMLVAFQTSP